MKRFVAVTVFVLLLSGILANNPVEARTYTYNDVKPSSSHYEAINYLFEEGFIGGYRVDQNVLAFKPNSPIKRSEVAAIFASVLGLPMPENHETIIKPYRDLNVNHPLILSIAANIESGIFKGEDHYFKDGVLNREQMATVLVRALELKSNGKSSHAVNLSNVSESHKDAVRLIADLQITTELRDFRPKENVTRAQFITFLYRAMERKGLQTFNPNTNKDSMYSQMVDYSYRSSYSDSAYIFADAPVSFHLQMNISKEKFKKGAEYAVAYPNSFILLDNENEFIHLPNKKEIIAKKRTNIPIYSRNLLTAAYKKPSDVPLPKGKTYAQLKQDQEAKQLMIREKNNLKHHTHFNLFTGNFEDSIRWRADNIGLAKDKRRPIDPAELVRLMNWTIETGDVYDGEYFSMYYDFTAGDIHIVLREVFFNR
ncbi:S-layer homology domain-containing protein [Sporosarcina sp. ACRSL]|uniref:S-layer homology domain-containing protein n=1 Tax=Sporosarcina sp. ACRSL TaxID=2918215 RepID=UPI001EF58F55|nr:S-layer homology domain-containing protein [Sporosarcina sp. ACRSL]MCG7344158.1 S-layer homology domain-containing protein [Sporosarcina sp. ACRSL]